jgi:hypothetical protein
MWKTTFINGVVDFRNKTIYCNKKLSIVKIRIPQKAFQVMQTNLIITHPGGAHFDEITAISLILATYPDVVFRVERRVPSLQELDDPTVWVVDIGLRYEPEKLNFDHHQSLDCPASFVLIAKYLALYESLSVMPWWAFKDEVDRFGPVESSIKYLAGDDLVNRSPVESWLVARFASDTQDSLPMLKTFGRHIIDGAQLLKSQIDFWKSCERIVISGVPAIIGETKESAGLEEFHRLDKNPPDIVISLDRNGEGWRLFRFDGAPVNFSLLADRPEIAFAHKNGFMAKTKERMAIKDVMALVSKAVTRV